MEQTDIMILCTGNPTHSTVASAVKKVFPAAEFASRATGYDLRLLDSPSESYFRTNIKKYSVFINSSFICYNAQLKLMELAHAEWMQADVKGHIINLGSTAEWSGLNSDYVRSKQALRGRSLELNEETGVSGIKTTHIIVAGVNDGNAGNEQYLSLLSVANAIEWILKNPDRIPLLQIDVAK
jgi:NAD(P)-dependent dehydrogenase (short-subunit alcohol dehydrogenase family)